MVKYYSSLSRTTRCASDNDTPVSEPKGAGDLKYHFLSCNRTQVPQQAYLRKLPRSNVGRNTGYPNWSFSLYSFILLAKCRDTTRWGHNRFQIIFNFSFTSHPITDAMQSQIRYWQSRKINHTHTQEFELLPFLLKRTRVYKIIVLWVFICLFVRSSLLTYERTNRQPRKFSWMLYHCRTPRLGIPTVCNNNKTNTHDV